MFRAAERTRILMTLVANQPVWVPTSLWIKILQVSAGSDIADQEIVNRLSSGDLVITADIPLAAQVIEKGDLKCFLGLCKLSKNSRLH